MLDKNWSEFFQKEYSFEELVIKFMNESDFLDFKEMKIRSKESVKEVKKRIVRNLEIRTQLNWKDGGDALENLIQKYVGEGENQIDAKQALLQFQTIGNFVDDQFIKKKIEDQYLPPGLKRIKLTGKLYERIKNPSNDLKLLIQCYYKYFTRAPSQKMRTIVRDETGIGKNWNMFSWDYYEFFDASFGDRKITKHAMWNQDLNRKTINSFKERCVDQLVKCISDGIEGYTFNENEIELMNNNIQNMLHKKLKKTNSKNAKLFMLKWKNQMTKKCQTLIIRLNDEKLVNQLNEVFYEEKNPFEKIKSLLTQKNNEFKFKSTENKTVEYKLGIFADTERTKSEYSKLKKSAIKEVSYKKYRSIKDKCVQERILKCIVAFLNTSGGKIIIGVDDFTLVITGIEKEKQRFDENISDEKFRDLFEQHVDGMIQSQKDIKTNFDDNVNYSTFEIPNGKIVCLIEVKPALDNDNLPGTYYYEGKTTTPYLRKGANCVPQEPKAWQEHIQKLMKK